MTRSARAVSIQLWVNCQGGPIKIKGGSEGEEVHPKITTVCKRHCQIRVNALLNLSFSSLRYAELCLKLYLYLLMKLLICQTLANRSNFKEEFQIEYFLISVEKPFIGPTKLGIIHLQTFWCLSFFCSSYKAVKWQPFQFLAANIILELCHQCKHLHSVPLKLNHFSE